MLGIIITSDSTTIELAPRLGDQQGMHITLPVTLPLRQGEYGIAYNRASMWFFGGVKATPFYFRSCNRLIIRLSTERRNRA